MLSDRERQEKLQALSAKEPEEELQGLNSICQECCDESRQKDFIPFSPERCHYCPVGRRVHEVDLKLDPKWGKVDWNGLHEQYYGF